MAKYEVKVQIPPGGTYVVANSKGSVRSTLDTKTAGGTTMTFRSDKEFTVEVFDKPAYSAVPTRMPDVPDSL